MSSLLFHLTIVLLVALISPSQVFLFNDLLIRARIKEKDKYEFEESCNLSSNLPPRPHHHTPISPRAYHCIFLTSFHHKSLGVDLGKLTGFSFILKRPEGNWEFCCKDATEVYGVACLFSSVVSKRSGTTGGKFPHRRNPGMIS